MQMLSNQAAITQYRYRGLEPGTSRLHCQRPKPLGPAPPVSIPVFSVNVRSCTCKRKIRQAKGKEGLV